jgi:hypothetical protein
MKKVIVDEAHKLGPKTTGYLIPAGVSNSKPTGQTGVSSAVEQDFIQKCRRPRSDIDQVIENLRREGIKFDTQEVKFPGGRGVVLSHGTPRPRKG